MKYIRKIIRSSENEDLEVRSLVERILKKKRGHVFKMPNKGKPVIMMLSGGLDSSATISWLIENYGLVIYPIFIDRGQSRVKQEEKSVRFFEKYYLMKYPKHFMPVFKLTTKIPPHEIRSEIIKNASTPITKSKKQRYGIPLFSSMLGSYAVQYAYYLQYTKNVMIRTIFRATLSSDVIYMSHEGLTSLRTANLNICAQTNDYSWQFTSPIIEKELNNFLDKEDLIKWGQKQHLPIHKTWSCYFNGKKHCGNCDGCYKRRESFKTAGIVDETKYVNDNKSLIFKFISTIKII